MRFLYRNFASFFSRFFKHCNSWITWTLQHSTQTGRQSSSPICKRKRRRCMAWTLRISRRSRLRFLLSCFFWRKSRLQTAIFINTLTCNIACAISNRSNTYSVCLSDKISFRQKTSKSEKTTVRWTRTVFPNVGIGRTCCFKIFPKFQHCRFSLCSFSRMLTEPLIRKCILIFPYDHALSNKNIRIRKLINNTWHDFCLSSRKCFNNTFVSAHVRLAFKA